MLWHNNYNNLNDTKTRPAVKASQFQNKENIQRKFNSCHQLWSSALLFFYHCPAPPQGTNNTFQLP